MRLTNWPPSTMFSSSSAGSRACCAGTATWPIRSSDCAAPGAIDDREVTGRDGRQLEGALQRRVNRRIPESRAIPVAERVGGGIGEVGMCAVADHDQRGIRRPVRLPVEVAHLVHGNLLERRLAADRQMTVRVIAVEQRCERAIGQRRGHVAKLPQAVGAELAHALELAGVELRTDDDVGEQPEPARREARDAW